MRADTFFCCMVNVPLHQVIDISPIYYLTRFNRHGGLVLEVLIPRGSQDGRKDSGNIRNFLTFLVGHGQAKRALTHAISYRCNREILLSVGDDSFVVGLC